MAIRHDLRRSIHQILTINRDGSYSTQGDRYSILMHFADDVVSLKYGLHHIQGLKEKHIRAVVAHWQEEGLANATLKNRLATLRYIAGKINKHNIVPSNDELDIGKRCYAPKFNRAVVNPDFSGIKNQYVHLSLQLQRVFGLRREESIKIKPHAADKKDHLILQPTWCKGGRGRIIPIRTEEQRHWLDAAKQFVNKNESLIPLTKNYIRQRYIYDKQVQSVGLCNLHGLRHHYAQTLYKELTGWEAPINGGPALKQLTPEQRKIDYDARMVISDHLGHGRIAVVSNYCG